MTNQKKAKVLTVLNTIAMMLAMVLFIYCIKLCMVSSGELFFFGVLLALVNIGLFLVNLKLYRINSRMSRGG